MPDTSAQGGGNHFARQLLWREGRSLIESKCRHCGAVLVGTASGTLPEEEKEHVIACPKARLARSVAWFQRRLPRFPVPRRHDARPGKKQG
jgi:hypothetical protein